MFALSWGVGGGGGVGGVIHVLHSTACIVH